MTLNSAALQNYSLKSTDSQQSLNQKDPENWWEDVDNQGPIPQGAEAAVGGSPSALV